MNCEEIEYLIWTYDDASTSEKKLIDEHLPSCAQCQQAWEESQELMLTVEHARENPPLPENNALLTHKIMAGIRKKGVVRNVRRLWIDVMNTAWLRYSLTCLGVALALSSLNVPLPQSRTPVTTKISETRSAPMISIDLMKQNRVRKNDTPAFSLIASLKKKDHIPVILNHRTP